MITTKMYLIQGNERDFNRKDSVQDILKEIGIMHDEFYYYFSLLLHLETRDY